MIYQYKIHVEPKIVESRGLHTTIIFSRFLKNIGWIFLFRTPFVGKYFYLSINTISTQYLRNIYVISTRYTITMQYHCDIYRGVNGISTRYTISTLYINVIRNINAVSTRYSISTQYQRNIIAISMNYNTITNTKSHQYNNIIPRMWKNTSSISLNTLWRFQFPFINWRKNQLKLQLVQLLLVIFLGIKTKRR